MNKPELADYGLTKELAEEIIISNKKKYREYLLIVNVLAVFTIGLITILVPVSSTSRLIVLGGLIVIFYPLNYIALYKLIVGHFFKFHPLYLKLREYNRAAIKYQSYLRSIK